MTQAELLTRYALGTHTYLEVGVQEGRSLFYVCGVTHIERMALCDSWGTDSGGSGRGDHAHIEVLIDGWNEETRPDSVTFLDGDSRELLPRFNETFELVHIDGGHSYEVALSDLCEGWRLCSHIMLVHDISFPEVWRAVCDFMSDKNFMIECHFGGHGTAVLAK